MHRLSARRLTARHIGVVLATTACTVDAPDQDQGFAGTGDDGVAAGTAADGSDDPFADVGGGSLTAAGDGGGPDVCKKMDFVFLIDSSVSMSDEQEALIASFPGFTETIRATTAVSDHQVMVLDTDAYRLSEQFEWSICSPEPECCETWCGGQVDNPISVCNGYPCTMPGSCEDRLGGGKTHDPYGEPCGIDEDRAFITSDGDSLEDAFECVARVGINGYVDEKPMEVLSIALGEEMTGEGGCNHGFLRGDALLVVVVITDEDDIPEDPEEPCTRGHKGSAGTPDGWFASVIAAKGDIESNVVVLSIVGPTDGSCPPLDKCEGGIVGAEPADRIVDFTERFTHGSIGSVCAASYDEFFADAVGVVAQACLEFEPVP